jgi:hypothetical protein
MNIVTKDRFLRPYGLTSESAAARLLGLRFRILPTAWVVCCQVDISATGWPMSRGVLPNVVRLIECDREASIKKRLWLFPVYDGLQSPISASLLDPIDFLSSRASLYVTDIPSHPFITAGDNTVPYILFFMVLDSKLRYIPEGRGIDFRWCHWNFSLT